MLLALIMFQTELCANNTPIPGTQLAYFIGFHQNSLDSYFHPQQKVYYLTPKYHHRGSYKTSWTKSGHMCKKRCVLDRWTGKALSCIFYC
jgi:hypothetical protein